MNLTKKQLSKIKKGLQRPWLEELAKRANVSERSVTKVFANECTNIEIIESVISNALKMNEEKALRIRNLIRPTWNNQSEITKL